VDRKEGSKGEGSQGVFRKMRPLYQGHRGIRANMMRCIHGSSFPPEEKQRVGGEGSCSWDQIDILLQHTLYKMCSSPSEMFHHTRWTMNRRVIFSASRQRCDRLTIVQRVPNYIQHCWLDKAGMTG